MSSEKGKLYLIPTPITENGVSTISQRTREIIHQLTYFIVERARTSRRFISSTDHPLPIDALMIEELPEGELSVSDIENLLKTVRQGHDVGIMSEAGMPAIADPGHKIVMRAQQMNIKVIPLEGPSSIMMALMASGLEGQRFAFHGYLSAKKHELPAQLRLLDQRSSIDEATQIWIEAPYRNKQILDAVEKNVDPNRNFCIAADMGGENGFVITRTVTQWKKLGWPEIHKVPAVFLIG